MTCFHVMAATHQTAFAGCRPLHAFGILNTVPLSCMHVLPSSVVHGAVLDGCVSEYCRARAPYTAHRLRRTAHIQLLQPVPLRTVMLFLPALQAMGIQLKVRTPAQHRNP